MKKSIPFLLLCLFLCFFGIVYGQTNPQIFGQDLTGANLRSLEEVGVIRCATEEYEKYLQEKFPERSNAQEFEIWLQPKLEQKRSEFISLQSSRISMYTIPVVFHVITDGVSTTTNISQTLIQAQLDQLNIDFRNLAGSSYSVAADINLEFCLAKVDESGNVLTEPGINRVTSFTNSSYSESFVNSDIKPATIWDPTKYLNVWLVNLSGGKLGFAQFPDSSGLLGLNPTYGTANTDGVVVASTSVGSVATPNPMGTTYNLGRTLTHEVGHWLGLRHIWGDGWISGQPSNASCGVDDFCNDTPNAGRPNFGCTTGTNTCTADAANDMIENYMDYTDDSCMNTFTEEQRLRIVTVLENSPRRMELLLSNVCDTSASTTDVTDKQNSLKVYPNPSNGVFRVQYQSNNKQVKYAFYNSGGKLIKTQVVNHSSQALQEFNLSHFPTGIYVLKITDGQKTISKKIIKK